jgi:hypothetical protein
MKVFQLRWVLYQLTDNLRQVMVAKCGELLRALQAMQRTHFRQIITGDQSWLPRIPARLTMVALSRSSASKDGLGYWYR